MTAKPGEYLTVKYYITNPYSTSINVGLGFSIRPSGTSGDGRSDPANDRIVPVSSGGSWYQRSFKVPTDATAGAYECVWAIWPGTPGVGSPYASTGWKTGWLTIIVPVVTSVTVSVSPGRVAQDGVSYATVIATVLDQYSNPMSGVVVSFSAAPTGYGTFSSATATTNSLGQATVRFSPSMTTVNPVTITITASAGGKSGTGSVVFSPPLVATASGSTHVTVTGSPVYFYGSASGGISPYTYSWSFGDGGSSTLQNPSHTYTSTGSYLARLTVVDAGGFGFSAQSTWSVTVNLPPPVVTSVTVSVSPGRVAQDGVSYATVIATVLDQYSNPMSGVVVSFSAAPTGYSSFSSPTAPTNGDGHAVVTVSPSVSTVEPVTVTITGTVGGKSGSDTVMFCAPLSVSASGPSFATVETSVQFFGSSSGGVSPHVHSWSFGDGSPPSSLQEPFHTFYSTGSYVVTLTVTDAGGFGWTAQASCGIRVDYVHPKVALENQERTLYSSLTGSMDVAYEQLIDTTIDFTERFEYTQSDGINDLVGIVVSGLLAYGNFPGNEIDEEILDLTVGGLIEAILEGESLQDETALRELYEGRLSITNIDGLEFSTDRSFWDDKIAQRRQSFLDFLDQYPFDANYDEVAWIVNEELLALMAELESDYQTAAIQPTEIQISPEDCAQIGLNKLYLGQYAAIVAEADKVKAVFTITQTIGTVWTITMLVFASASVVAAPIVVVVALEMATTTLVTLAENEIIFNRLHDAALGPLSALFVSTGQDFRKAYYAYDLVLDRIENRLNDLNPRAVPTGIISEFTSEDIYRNNEGHLTLTFCNTGGIEVYATPYVEIYSPDGLQVGAFTDTQLVLEGEQATFTFPYSYSEVGQYTVIGKVEYYASNGLRATADTPTTGFAVEFGNEAEVNSHFMCASVPEEYPNDPADVRSIFYSYDSLVVSWVRFDNLATSHTVRWDWFDPHQSLYLTRQESIEDPQLSGYSYWEWCKAWAGIYIEGFPPARRPGDWTVKVYLDDDLVLTETFQLQSSDNTPPSQPVPDDGVSDWSSDDTPTFTWPVSSDTQSDIDEYSWKVDDNDEIWTAYTDVTIASQSDGIHTFYVRAFDMAGNPSGFGEHVFQIDTAAPPVPAVVSSTHPDQSLWYTDDSPHFTWTDPLDISGIAGYSYVLDQGALTTPDTVSEPPGNSRMYSGLADGEWYFHLRAVDTAGNWGPASHYRVRIGTRVPLSGWVVDSELTNAAHALDSSASDLLLELDAVDTSSRVTIYSLNVPSASLSGYDYIDVSVTGSANARVLLRFFLDDGTGFDFAYWSDVATLDTSIFYLAPYAGRTMSVVYVALMSSDGFTASIDLSKISLGVAENRFDLTIAASVNGATSLGSGVYSYVAGSEVSVTASPDVGYQLCHWLLDDVIVGGDQCVVCMDGDHSLSAVFIPENVVSLTCWQVDDSLTNAPYTLDYSSLHLELDADEASDRATIYSLNVPAVSLTGYDHIDVSIAGTSNARVLLRFFLDDGTGFDVVYWGDPATLDAVNYDLSAYEGRTMTAVYIALMSSDGFTASIGITRIALVAEAPPPEFPLAGWAVDSGLTNALYTLSSTPSILSLDLDAVDTASRMTIYSVAVPSVDLGGFDHIDVSVTGTSNARVLLRFFMDNGAGFDVIYWGDAATLDAINFDLSPYAGRTLTIAYVALMSSNGLDASIDITQIALVATAPPPVVPLAGWTVDLSLTNAPYTLDSTPSLLSLDLAASDASSRVTIYTLAVPTSDLGGFDHIDVSVTGTSNARILLRFFLDDGSGFDVVYWSDPATLDAISFDLSPYVGRTMTIAYIALMSSDGSAAGIDVTAIALVA
jgi:PKD repeat protein